MSLSPEQESPSTLSIRRPTDTTTCEPSLEDIRQRNPDEILTEAAALVSGQRAEQHGDYVELHKRTAELWSAYLRTTLSPSDVAFCMVLLKVARDESGAPNEDDGIDASAYTALWAALSQRNA